jgi:hypothetical protein
MGARFPYRSAKAFATIPIVFKLPPRQIKDRNLHLKPPKKGWYPQGYL